MATLMLVCVMAVFVRVLVAVSGRRMRVFMPVMGVRLVLMGMLVLMFVFGVAAHLKSPPLRLCSLI
jgi:hypothetical protein